MNKNTLAAIGLGLCVVLIVTGHPWWVLFFLMWIL